MPQTKVEDFHAEVIYHHWTCGSVHVARSFLKFPMFISILINLFQIFRSKEIVDMRSSHSQSPHQLLEIIHH